MTNRKTNTHEQGEIKKLQEVLRQTCIKRFSKSANGHHQFR